MPLEPDEANRLIAAARRGRPPASDAPLTDDELADIERGILLRRAEQANADALPQPKESSRPS